MKNVIGTPARGESFYSRELIISDILHLLQANNLQIAAPRRIGKTSILFHLLDRRLRDNIYVYVDTEAIDDENEFFKKILKELLRVEEIRHSGRLKRLFEQGQKFLKKVKSIHFLEPGIEFHEGEGAVDYKEDLLNLLLGLELENQAALIILLDEFPQTIQNIIDRNKGDRQAAKKFLQSNREIRLHPEILPKVKFIVTGSIGLNHTVAGIEASAFINDLASIEIGALAKTDAKDFLNKLLLSNGLEISLEAAEYLLDRLEWLIPFHIQLAVQELISIARSRGVKQITSGLVNEAFDAIIQARNNNHFEHYHSRLRKQFKGKELEFVFEVLEVIAQEGVIARSRIYDISVTYELQHRWRNIVEVLVYDGYINNVGDHNVYRFNSPIVRMWWQKFICK